MLTGLTGNNTERSRRFLHYLHLQYPGLTAYSVLTKGVNGMNGEYEDFMTELVTGQAPPSLLDIIGSGGAAGQGISQAEAEYYVAQTGQVPPGAPKPEVTTAGVPAITSIIPGAGALAGIGSAIYGILQALGLGEGGGLFGNNLLGGDEFMLGGIPFGGPGLPEPPAQYVLKEWHVSYPWGRLQYYLVQLPRGGRKIAMYNTKTGKWKVWSWRKPHLAVIGKNMPSHKQLTRLRRNLSRHRVDASTILKYTDPVGYAKRLGYRKYRRRR